MDSTDIALTRRSLLAGLLGIPAAAPAAERTSRMRFGFTTYQWGQAWDIPTLIANCARAGALGVELRTSMKYGHGVELDIAPQTRREVKKRFEDSPVKLLGIACGERFDSPDPAKLEAAIEAAKGYLKLSHDVGSRGVRVFPNDFHKDVPQEKTVEQIARSLNVVGQHAGDLGQMVRVENHGTAGRLATLRRILDQVDQPSVRVMLNSDARDAEGGKFAENFALVKDRLADVLHMHDLEDSKFPYQLQADLLIDIGWDGWWLVEQSSKVPDPAQALIEMRKQWDELVARSLKRVAQTIVVCRLRQGRPHKTMACPTVQLIPGPCTRS